jgi:hypothetical protein
VVGFVEQYDVAEDPYARRQFQDPDRWGIVYPNLTAAADRLRVAGRMRVVVKGEMRLPMGFATGAALRHVRGFTVSAVQGADVWAPDTAGPAVAPVTPTQPVGLGGDDLAVVVSVSNQIETAVQAFITREQLPISELVVVSPAGGTANEVVQSGPEAASLAQTLCDSTREALERSGAARIHLFISAPVGLAVLLGHRWNALAETVAYEHLVYRGTSDQSLSRRRNRQGPGTQS